jgi:hypothetical protein
VLQHLSSAHGEEKERCIEGEHFCQGLDFPRILEEWRRENGRVAAKFLRQMESITTVEDFLFEAGEDVWGAA